MLLANYASDSDSDAGSDNESGPSRVAAAAPKAAPAPAPAPAPVKAKRKGPIKIGLDLPKPEAKADEKEKEEEDRSFKKPRIAGAGSSSLLGMLPPPKRKLPTAASKPNSLSVNKSMAAAPKTKLPTATLADSDDEGDKPALMLPASMARAAAKKPAVDLDLFGLAETPKPKPVVAAATPKPPTISAAPAVADFTPPPPTASDPYPGYYQLPSGAWAAYDAAYYTSFFDDGSSALAAAEAKKENRVGRAWAELDEGRADVVEYDVSTGLAEGKAARELEAARLASKPKLTDDYTYTDVGQTRGLAAERHQLTSLLSSAFSQREELEARIAQNKKNMRNAGNKYGF